MVFKAGNRSFFVVSKRVSKEQALTIANNHYKAKVCDLEIQSGKMIDDYTLKIGCKGDVWVVSRRCKA